MRRVIMCFQLYLKCTYYFFHRLTSMSIQVIIYTFCYFNRNSWIYEICCTNLDS